MTSQFERNQTAKAIRGMRKILSSNPPIDNPPLSPLRALYSVHEEAIQRLLMVLYYGAIIACMMLMLKGCESPSWAFSDEQYVNAIYKAEGGLNAQYPYGIRSLQCSSLQDCRRICLNTVRHNRKRWYQSKRSSMEFIAYLGSRYCPTSGKGLSGTEKKENQYWVKNVTYFLQKDT